MYTYIKFIYIYIYLFIFIYLYVIFFFIFPYCRNFTTLQLNEDNFVEDVDKATRKAFADLNKGSTHSIPIGFLNLGKEKLYDNIQQATKRMLEFYEQKNVSVVSINLRYMSMTIPLYIHALKNIIHPGYY
ncbi:hypothetical protein PFMALIP_04811 [Plasmodium falciparum MaliPS096_E11]|uniref:Uncharacterized protein n=1 Tax=Plasmodium falciparum MaliPS096_E11 TaxID=1036727 RepID=A0A024WIY9_PLAFA|nr:hypothetical protein PFMALIP_04811 [Plasmodium falciparum MaliPS096_E11]